MAEWWSIEVFHGTFPARQWQDAHSRALTEAAVTTGATSWEWHEHRWGVVFEVALPEPGAGERADLTATAPPGLPRMAGHTP